MFCRAMAIGLLGSRIAYALKEPYLLVYRRHGDISRAEENCQALALGFKETLPFCISGRRVLFFQCEMPDQNHPIIL